MTASSFSAIIQPMKEDTGQQSRGLPQRLKQALTTDAEGLFQAIRDPATEVLRALLRNPELTENHLLALLKRKDLSEDTLKAVYRQRQLPITHALQLALAKNPRTPGPIVQSILPHLRLFELVNLCFLSGVTPDQKLAAERMILKRLPTMELGNKVTLARRGTSMVLNELIREGHSTVLQPCLNNPRLKEVSILQFLNSSAPNAESISCIARHPKWKNRPNIQNAILKNRQTPRIWYTLFLPKVRLTDLRLLAAARTLSAEKKELIRKEMAKRSPRDSTPVR